MRSKVKGFEVEVTVKDGVPHVWISFPDGRVVVDTDMLSVTGMENMAAVFTRAARIGYEELEAYWHGKHQELVPSTKRSINRG